MLGYLGGGITNDRKRTKFRTMKLNWLFRLLAIMSLGAALLGPGTARATEQESRALICAIFVTGVPILSPIVHARFIGIQSNAAVECLAWQTFIYLNWPAKEGSPGDPDMAARLGGPGPTVWETFKRHDRVFLPNAATPAPWGADVPAAGAPRRLTTRHQSDGSTLIDRAGRPVYYEMLLNRDEFRYIVENRLYDADAQLALAETKGIELPTGATSAYGTLGAVEVKAAWKILTPEERAQRPLRFHTAQAMLEDGTVETVGLVGLHIYQRVSDFNQGVWTSFAQIDNAPLAGAHEATTRYSFYDPGCTQCLVNAVTEPPTGTQVEQVFPVPSTVRNINSYVRSLIASADPASPWQFYEMLGTQWPTATVRVGAPGDRPPLPEGTPSTFTLMNPVIETHQQLANVSCIGCHAKAATAKAAPNGPFAANYSYLLAHAQSATARGPSPDPK